MRPDIILGFFITVSKPLLTPIHNIKMETFLQNWFMCVLKDINDVKILLDKNLTGFIR